MRTQTTLLRPNRGKRYVPHENSRQIMQAPSLLEPGNPELTEL
jgi:hypothetical protein